VYSAQDYIDMRGNAHRGKWLTLVLFLVPIGVTVFYVGWVSYTSDDGLLSVWQTIVLLSVTMLITASCIYKAYIRAPFAIKIGDSLSGDSGSGDGDCGGD
jgi:Na+/H+-dicarboxylate symporter